MIEKRTFADLAHVNHDWLQARHHFSFGKYYDPARMGFGPIRVWNDDEIAAKTGFPMHPHRDMEIITYVREGAITHRDSLGNEGRTEAGDVQVMSAGTGVTHSEYNLEDETTRLFQIWIEPRAPGGEPRWDANSFPKGELSGDLEILASGFDEDIDKGALMIRSDARLYGATLTTGTTLQHDIAEGAHVYLVASAGKLRVNGEEIAVRDSLAIRDVPSLEIEALEQAELVFVEAFDRHN
ncbi:MAG: pirin family protein [Parasphingorhabdus sp.]|uniref:pirin family protein n=1 Tax=Parasphingorhabdus sp. TaxID=2709688 RepID=UPI003002AB06